MTKESDIHDDLITKAKSGDSQAIAALFDQYRDRLRRMVKFRLDDRLARRVDPSDVLQDAYVDVQTRIHEFQDGEMPFFLWLRLKVAHRLIDVHRFHLGAQKRDARRELSRCPGNVPEASSFSIAAHLLGTMTSASGVAVRAETRICIQHVLSGMDDIDREVLVLRHFEDLTNAETAQVLDISQNAASNRYIRALKRLKDALMTEAAVDDLR